jgi:type I restriction enzyme, S subunit
MADNFPQSWQFVLLEDCMEAIIDYRGKTPRKTPYGIPLITAKIVKNGRIETPNEFIDPAEYYDWMRRGLPKSGDVLVTTEAPLGEVAQLGEERVALAQRLIALRGIPGLLENSFLKFLMQSSFVQEQLAARASGTTVLGIKQSELRKILLPLPEIREQQAIAYILGTLDDKIELNRRINQTLEAIARAIFKSWFVDFDPVRAKAIGRQPPGLASHIADLFPDSFENFDLGEIPRGWKVYHLPELVEINPLRQLSKGTLAPYLDMAGMPTEGYGPTSWIEREVGSGMKFINGDTLMARITPCLENGKTAYVDFLKNGEIGWGSTEYIILRPQGSIPTVFGYLLARSNEFRTFAIQRMTGSSGRQRVPADSLAQYRLVAPAVNYSVFNAFGQIVNPLFERARSGLEQSRTLSTLRKTLLPKLISGEFMVPDAERIVSRAM